MTKPELLALMRLLSALESVMMMRDTRLPDYLHDQLHDAVAVLERDILAVPATLNNKGEVSVTYLAGGAE